MGFLVDAVNRLLPGRWRLVKLSAQGLGALDRRTSGRPLISDAEDITRYAYLGPKLGMVRLRDGHLLYIDPEDVAVAGNIIMYGYWEPQLHRVLDTLITPGMTVVDVGANVGVHTMAAARRVGAHGRVIAVEANAGLADLIERSALMNGYAGRLNVVAKAAGAHAGVVEFVTSRQHSGSGHTRVAASPEGPGWQVDAVEMFRLDDLGAPRVDFIHIDAEGSEPLILRGAERLLSQPDVIVCMEWAVVQMASRASVPETVDWLTGLGFRFWRVTASGELVSIEAAELIDAPFCDLVMARRLPAAAEAALTPRG